MKIRSVLFPELCQCLAMRFSGTALEFSFTGCKPHRLRSSIFNTSLSPTVQHCTVCYYRDSHILQAFLHTPTHLSIPVNFFCSTITLGFVRQSWCNYRHHTAASKYYEGFVHSRLFFLTCSHPISLKQQEASRHWKHILKELCQRALLTNP